MNLEEIPGLLNIEKVKPKVSHTYARVTQVYGSMEGKDVLKIVKTIQDQKDMKSRAKEEAMEKKSKQRQQFHECKNGCICKTKLCKAAGLKECPSCHNILRSTCGKIACQENGE